MDSRRLANLALAVWPGADQGGGKQVNTISGLSKWKIFDNLRRSINSIALLVFMLLGWVLLPGSPLIWTAAVFGIVAFPIYSSLSTDIFRRPKRVEWVLYFDKIRSDLKMNTVQAVTSFLFLPHQAYLSLDAIVRTLYRMFISRSKMLEWATATQVDRQHANGSITGYWSKMWISPVWAVLCLALVTWQNPPVLLIAIPICAGWILTPWIAYYLAQQPGQHKRSGLSRSEKWQLRGYARRTWHFFEQYVNEEHSWLPPDNVQEDPYVGPVGRTSPTNIGLALVATSTAYEMGYITFTEMVDRLQASLSSMKELERYRGHFYNWYSTKLGDVLSPSYVSTVDSGNLAGSLVVVQQALEQIDKRQWPKPTFWNGLNDTMMVLDELLEELRTTAEYERLAESLSIPFEELQSVFPDENPTSISDWKQALEQLAGLAEQLASVNMSILQEEFEDLKFSEWRDWFSRPSVMINSQLSEINSYYQQLGKNSSNNDEKNRANINGLSHLHVFPDTVRKTQNLAALCKKFLQEMDFSLMYNKERELFSIGYNVDRAAQDDSYYDLLASEARLASFLAIAKGEVPPEHWFRLSRRLTSIDQNEILLSWSGTMFEYLMPLLFMSRFDNTLLSNTYDHVVTWQQNYGSLRERPWGFSESGYGILNLELHYQYRAFGVPGLGLRRGLAEDYVVAPYAGMLALMVQPKEALHNLERLRNEGAYGANGFYEAIDYTSIRGNENGKAEKSIIKMYMAHHQGMSLLAMVNILQDNLIQRLFHDHPLVRSCELLLQERIPRGIPIKEPRPIDVELEPPEEEKEQHTIDHAGINELDSSPPRTHLLSNGNYSTLITHSGTGYSFYKDITLTRWRSDIVQDKHGLFFYVRDLDNDKYWSVGHQPVKRKADRYDSWFHAGKIQTARVDDWIESFMEVCVSPEDDIELRKITLTNYSDRKRRIELTSYAEVVINTQQADRSHPAFSNLFVQTEYVQEYHSVLARRRPRESEDEAVWLVHTVASEDFEGDENMLQIETDREQFIGRNRSMANPRALDPGVTLSGTVGNVKDPIMSLRRIVTLGPGEKKSFTFGLGCVQNREAAIAMGDRYDNLYATERVFELASIYSSVELDQLNISGEQANYFQRLAGHLVFNSEGLRAPQDILKRNRKKQASLWAHSISGDIPILVYHIDDTKFIRDVGVLLKAHGFWRQKGLKVDLVFMNDHPPSYIDELQESIQQQIQFSAERNTFSEQGGVFVLRSDELSADDCTLIDTVAKVVIRGKLPNLSVLSENTSATPVPNRYRPVDFSSIEMNDIAEESELHFFNGFGGFTPNGKEYVIQLRMDPQTQRLKYPPAPWINVISNPEFGFLTSEKGSGYTWSQNSRENKLSPWSNDAVLDPSGEAIYIRDEEQQCFLVAAAGAGCGKFFL
ncbi:MAG: glucoamylase family protein [Fodinibius sp.]|nr:glucoamylase family protein [Fodinibius sp.]